MPKTSTQKKPVKAASVKPAKKVISAKKTAKPIKKTAPVKSEPVVKTAIKPIVKKTETAKKPLAKTYFYANGKRKMSVASVRLFNGKGIITVNNRSFENYFPVRTDQDKIISPFRLVNCLKMFDVSARVHGGGIHSQAEAIRHGISKALLIYKAELRNILKPAGFLTRDSRVKERKKYGLKRARKAPQWQKR